jgi:hypothetical protein
MRSDGTVAWSPRDALKSSRWVVPVHVAVAVKDQDNVHVNDHVESDDNDYAEVAQGALNCSSGLRRVR